MNYKINSRTALIAALLVSVAINLLIAGIVIGRNAMGHKPDIRPHLGWMMQDMDDASRKKIRASIRQHMQAAKPLQNELHMAQNRLRELIGAEEFDRQAVREALAEVRGAAQQFQALTHEQMLEVLETLKPEERMHVFRFLTERRPHQGPRKGPREGPREGPRDISRNGPQIGHHNLPPRDPHIDPQVDGSHDHPATPDGS